MEKKSSAVKGLGEIALRAKDLDSLQRFYEDVVGLELMKRFPHAAFFRIADGYGGHTQILALFDRSKDLDHEHPDSAKSTIDHLAFGIDLADFQSEKRRLEELGLDVKIAEHDWVHWRSIYFHDLEGNLVEFVTYDTSV